ncbi:TatD family hydrolase [Caldivirga sp.]|uniref:TatD family hydrolase n=1 Tax=Caldivirga sp. TaxID=2080243 RepID=UPI0025C6D03B|nr:TatD family hydrolase [Caldivirga sp.]
MLVDSHVHLYEFSNDELGSFNGMILVSVAEDVKTSMIVLNLTEGFGSINPCIGIHPWNVNKVPFSDVAVIEKLVKDNDVRCLGEVGLDLRFVPNTIDKQRRFFSEFLRMAKEYDLVLNIHSPSAWREVFEMITKADVNKVMFHWYTGPLDLIRDLTEQGYYISINAAVKVQEKSRRVAEAVPLRFMLTESDGPYEYRGIRLTPLMIRDTVNEIAKIRGIDVETVEDSVYFNYTKLFK